MAKLPQTSIKALERTANKFKRFAKIDNFSFEDFEEKAERFEKEHPGKGYQMAYQDNIKEMFRKIFENHMKEVEKTPSLDEFVKYYDNTVMKDYLDERKKQGMAVNINLNGKAMNLETLESFRDVLAETPRYTVLEDVRNKFNSGELTVDSTYAIAKARKNSIPTKKEAHELAAYAKVIDEINQKRPMWQKIFTFWVHFKERNAISALRNLAAKSGNVAVLTDEASNESLELRTLRNNVIDGVLREKDRIKVMANKQAAAQNDQNNKTTEIKVEEVAPVIETTDNKNPIAVNYNNDVLDQTIDLGGDIDSGVTKDDADIAESFFKDGGEAIERVEFDDDEVDIFPNISDEKGSTIEDPVKTTQRAK